MKKLFSLLIVALSAWTLQAQVGMGKWRTHLAYNRVEQLAQSENKIFAISDNSLFSVDKRDGGMELYSKVNGLNGTTITNMAYDDNSKTLIITYFDGNIDFVSARGITNLPDLYNKQMSANKGVNHLLFHADKAYLACNFGILTLNIPKVEIQDTYFIGDNASEVKVLNTALFNGNLYAVSETTIYVAAADSPNLINYEVWKKMSGLPGGGGIQAMHKFGDYLVLLRNGKLYKQDASGAWSDLDVAENFVKITVSNDYLQAFTASQQAIVYDTQFAKTAITNLSSLKDGVYDKTSGKFWFGSSSQGVAEYTKNGASPAINFYQPAGPAVNSPYTLKFVGERLYMLPGGRWSTQDERPGVVMTYENNQWKTAVSNASIVAITKRPALDFIDVAVDPKDAEHYFVSSYGNGVFEFKNNALVRQYTLGNSPLETAITGNDLYVRVAGLQYDKDNNLWIMDDKAASANRFKILKSDGQWFTLDLSRRFGGDDYERTLSEILFSKLNPNHKWFLARRHLSGIVVIDDKGTLENTDDDQLVTFKSFKLVDGDKTTEFSPVDYYCFAQDRNGAIWLGTKEGPVVFNNTERVFDPNFAPTRIKIPRNDGTSLADYLLEKEEIRAIAVDGANRKWLGTKASGVYLMSENGQETIHHFTTQNSPLLANDITNIAIHPRTGEVFIGTARGLVSFQSDAGEPGSAFNNVHAYPNPVRENYTGVITITGLVEKTTVKITDVSGNLINETTSNGSIATWDGKNKLGQKVSTGVYLAICLSPDGQQSATTKILVIN